MAFTQTVASAALKMNYLSIIVQICIFNGRVFVLEFRFWFESYLDGCILTRTLSVASTSTKDLNEGATLFKYYPFYNFFPKSAFIIAIKHKQKQMNIASDSVNLLLQRLYILHARHLISNIFIITTQTTHDIPTLC